MIQSSDQRWVRITAVGALVAALGLSACGRKGPLDQPPAAAVPVQQQPLPGQPVDALGPDGRPAAVAAPPPSSTNRPFILDWLIN